MESTHGNGFEAVIALILLIIGLVVGFYAGSYYESGQTDEGVSTTTPVLGVSSTSTTVAYYKNVNAWQKDSETESGFSLAYPLDFPVTTGSAKVPSADWSLAAHGTLGNLILTLTIPKAFEPQTNFSEAKLTVGTSAAAKAVASCTIAGQGEVTNGTKDIGGVTFSVFAAGDAGAGNLYESTSYRALHNGRCYAAEYTIHSTQLANYPSEYGLTQFDKTKLTDVLDRIVGTFTFL